jgi:hypothetical protein
MNNSSSHVSEIVHDWRSVLTSSFSTMSLLESMGEQLTPEKRLDFVRSGLASLKELDRMLNDYAWINNPPNLPVEAVDLAQLIQTIALDYLDNPFYDQLSCEFELTPVTVQRPKLIIEHGLYYLFKMAAKQASYKGLIQIKVTSNPSPSITLIAPATALKMPQLDFEFDFGLGILNIYQQRYHFKVGFETTGTHLTTRLTFIDH